MGKFIEQGLLSCPKMHTALGHPFYNVVDLKEGEGIGTKIKVQCGLCGEKFEGLVEKINQRYENS